jgi:hypothetical protein
MPTIRLQHYFEARRDRGPLLLVIPSGDDVIDASAVGAGVPLQLFRSAAII